MRTVWQDIMYGCRMLARSPGFSVVVVLLLAVGIGVNTTIFTAVKAWLSVCSFPCDRPERIVLLSEQNHPWGIEERLIAPEAFRSWEQRCTSFEAVSCWQAGSLRLHTDGDTQQVPAYRWSPRIFTILGISPPLGRPFGPDEDQPGKDHVAILSHEFWQSQFGADPNILGQVALLNDEPYRIIGVRSPETGMSEMMGTIWIPLPAAASESKGRWSDVGMLARLKPDKSLAQACIEVDTIAKSMAQTYGGVHRDWTVRAEPLRQWMNKLSRPAFFLHVPVGLVLLIACSNAASLIVARGSARKKELSVRLALGADRQRIVRQLLTESLLYALPAGVAALCLVQGGVLLLLRLARPKLAWMIGHYGMDNYLLLFAVAVSVLTGLGCGLSPALLLTRENLTESLRVTGGQVQERSRWRFLHGVVVFEIALSLALLMSAGLLIRSFVRVQHIDMGFRPEGVLTIDTDFSNLKNAAGTRDLYRQILESVEAIPGVQSVALSRNLPWEYSESVALRPVEAPEPDAGQSSGELPQLCPINPAYFSTLGIPLLRGRGFTPQDAPETARTVIVNEVMARLLFPYQDAVGKHLEIRDRGMGVHEIVGVVGNVKLLESVLKPQDKPVVYVPFSRGAAGRPSLAVRTSLDAASLTRVLSDLFPRTHPDLTIRRVGTMKDRMARALSLNWPRLAATYMGVLSVVALVFSATGVYGIMAYAAGQRTHEIGIRLALGARTRDVLLMVMRRGLKLTGLGLALGSLAAYGTARVLSRLLYETSPLDSLTLVSVYALLTVVALLACYLPARRASKLDPMVALRCE